MVKYYKYVILVLVGLLISGVTLAIQNDERPFIGVRFDPAGLDALLTKHLKLNPGQGLVIRNVLVGSPADRAGLERDDIVFGCNGEEVNGFQAFVDLVRGKKTGTSITLDIIHNGDRQSVEVTLKATPDKMGTWKYPADPTEYELWRPGRAFRLSPDQKKWRVIPFGDIPKGDTIIKEYFHQQYTFRHMDEQGNAYTVTIVGNPDNSAAAITVRQGEEKYTVSVDDIDQLPKKYRQTVRESLKQVRESIQVFPDDREEPFDRFRGFAIPDEALPHWQEDDFDRRLPFGPGVDQMFEEMEKRMEDMMRQMQEMQRRHKDLLNRIPDNLPESLHDQAEEL